MKVEIWSDIVCPFCYIGKRKFEQALQHFAAKEQVEVIWRSFQLDPDAEPAPDKTVAQSLSEKKGWSLEHTKGMMDQVTNMAREAGLDYKMDRSVVANTLNAHRLTHLAAKYGKQDAAKEKLFQAYFTEGKDVGSADILQQLGQEIGLPAAAVQDLWQSNVFADAVLRDQYEAQQVGVRGVPFFVFNNKYAVSGAQPSAVFAEVMERVWQEERPVQEVLDGSFCSPDGIC